MGAMAAAHAPRRPSARFLYSVFALVLLAGVLPAGPAARAASGPTLQVSPEVSDGGAANSATLTAVLSGSQHGDTYVDFEVMNGPADKDGDTPDTPDTTCKVPSGQVRCQVAITATEAGTSLVRAWIRGTKPDMTEARLANDRATPLIDALDPVADCRPSDPGTCHDGSTPNAGDVPEPDATDVVQVTFLNFTDGRLKCVDPNGSKITYLPAATSTAAAETYTCTLTTSAGAPIAGAFIDGKILPKMKSGGDAGNADFNDLCQTDANGRCATGDKIGLPTGGEIICFWAEPAKQGTGNQGTGDQGQDNAYKPGGKHTDGGDCGQDSVMQPTVNDVTDVVYLDADNPRPEGLDVQPENQLLGSPARFSLQGTVYDQFGQPYTKGGVKLQAKLFEGSVLAGGADNDLAKLDGALTCTTAAGSAACAIPTAEQTDLGSNLACVWLDGKKPVKMVGEGDQESATCTAPPAPWQDKGDEEPHLDPTNDDGPPSPVTDGLDVVRFGVQSRPVIAAVTPTERRQDTSGDVLGIAGSSFLPSAQISISGTGVTLGPTAVVSDKRLEASLAVAADAAPGPRDVTVTNRSDGGTATCTGCFRVIGQGYWMVAADGGVFAFGDARFLGAPAPGSLNRPVVAIRPTPSGLGYWLVASDGGIFTYGDAPFLGSAGSLQLSRPIVSMAATPSGKGYWLVASDGGVFAYGDARFYGSTSHLTLSKPIVSIVATPSGRGYWLMGSDGGIFNFGDARFYGGTGDLALDHPIVDMAPTRTGKGYWLVGSDGGIFAYGDAVFYGSVGGAEQKKPIVAITATPFGKGYWLVASDGGVFAYGDARFLGSTGGVHLNQPIVGLARR
jgi:hypothetical protein